MRIEPLADDVEILVGATYQSNATLFHAAGGTLVVDALASRADALVLADHLRARHQQPRIFVSTHGFSDHLAALSLFPGVPLVAHADAERSFARETFRTSEEASFWVEPTLRIRHPVELQWGRYRLLLEPLGGHTESTLGIDVPALDTVFVGDTVVGNIVYLRYADRPRLRAALAWARERGRSRVVQGHGGIHPAACLDSALHYLDALEAAARTTVRSGSLRLEACVPAGVAPSEFETVFHERNLDLLRIGALRSSAA
jgi:glyoxylase-like metal-dependent hydrolase (beta-lactamase superfamily II)